MRVICVLEQEMDFSRLSKPKLSRPSTNPREIFARLPRMEAAPNDLWHGQVSAIDQWHEHRLKRDVLLSLNTGSGKTIIGLLIAQSLVNEGVQNVLYCCPTIDLVRQTSREADRVGIKH
jgi:superfamily II DNA or RNA helicase